jgi:hypothetical protein
MVFDIHANLDWLAANGYPAPCTVSSLSAVPTNAPAGCSAVTGSAVSVQASFSVDVPIGYMLPTSSPTPSATSIALNKWSEATSRWAAYPPRLVKVLSSQGNVSYLEVEESPDRGTLGLRAMETFNGNTLIYELGGGAEVFDGWGIDVDLLGVTKVTSGVEESHPGFNAFTYAGTAFPPVTSGVTTNLILPAPPLFTEAQYLANVLDNRAVPRCREPGGCLDVIYSLASHTLTATNGASLALLDPGPIQTTAPPVTAGASVVAPGLLHASPMTPLGAATPNFSRAPSPEEQSIKPTMRKGPLTRTSEAAPSCPIIGTAESDGGVSYSSTVALSTCQGLTSASGCPTTSDPIKPDEISQYASSTTFVGSVSSITPIFTGRENQNGTCVAHSNTFNYEALLNRLDQDLAPKRGFSLPAGMALVPNPAMDFSADGNLSTSSTCTSTSGSGCAGPGNATPLFAEGYWPAREGNFWNWVTPNTSSTQANAALSACQSKGFWSDPFCAAQGQPPPGVYRDYSMMVDTYESDPFTAGSSIDVPWALADSYIDLVTTNYPVVGSAPSAAIQAVVSSVDSGIPVLFTLTADNNGEGIVDTTGGSVPLLTGMSWFVPPELAGCDVSVLQKAYARHEGHATNIVGYYLVGSKSAPDPIHSYFVIENNWGTEWGYHGFYTMSLAAFAVLGENVAVQQLACSYPSAACANYHPIVSVAGGISNTGSIMPFGGLYQTCIAAPSDTSGTSFTAYSCARSGVTETLTVVPLDVRVNNGPSTALLQTSAGLCVTSNGTNANPVTLAPCTSGANQQWVIHGGQITLGASNYCLDVYGANSSSNGTATIDVTTCNGTNAQSFLPAGYTMGLQSTEGKGGDAAYNFQECLDNGGDAESSGSTLDDATCNRTNAQWWVFTTSNELRIADSPSLCATGTSPKVTLASCAATNGNSSQMWYLAGGGGRSVVHNNATANSCLDIDGNAPTSGTPVDVTTCNGTAAQVWIPFMYYDSPMVP